MNIYPLNAIRLDISFMFDPFNLWWKPRFVKRNITEFQKEQGEDIWWARWLFLQITYKRWV
jgi:hypothetical protein